MPATNLTLNPYQPILLDPPEQRIETNPFSTLEVCCTKSMLYRHLRLSGRLETEIVWDAQGTSEYVSVGGSKVAQKIAFWYVPRFEFTIPARDKQIVATIEVSVSWLLIVSGFRLTLDNAVAYSEGKFKVSHPTKPR